MSYDVSRIPENDQIISRTEQRASPEQTNALTYSLSVSVSGRGGSTQQPNHWVSLASGLLDHNDKGPLQTFQNLKEDTVLSEWATSRGRRFQPGIPKDLYKSLSSFFHHLCASPLLDLWICWCCSIVSRGHRTRSSE
jgi:hypothetical protein